MYNNTNKLFLISMSKINFNKNNNISIKECIKSDHINNVTDY